MNLEHAPKCDRDWNRVLDPKHSGYSQLLNTVWLSALSSLEGTSLFMQITRAAFTHTNGQGPFGLAAKTHEYASDFFRTLH